MTNVRFYVGRAKNRLYISRVVESDTPSPVSTSPSTKGILSVLANLENWVENLGFLEHRVFLPSRRVFTSSGGHRPAETRPCIARPA